MLRALVDLVEHNRTTPRVVELHVTLSAEAAVQGHPVHDYFVRRYAVVVDMIAEAFDQAAADGHLQPGVDSAASARTMVALMDGLQGQWLLDPAGVNMAEEMRRFLRPLITVDLDGPSRALRASSRRGLATGAPPAPSAREPARGRSALGTPAW